MTEDQKKAQERHDRMILDAFEQDRFVLFLIRETGQVEVCLTPTYDEAPMFLRNFAVPRSSSGWAGPSSTTRGPRRSRR